MTRTIHISGMTLRLRPMDGKNLVDLDDLFRLIQRRSRVIPYEAARLADVMTGR